MQNATRNALNHGASTMPSLQLVEVAAEPNDDATFWRMDPNVVTMERLRDGDMEAFQVLFSRYNGDGSSFADRLVDSDSPGPAQRLAYRKAATEIIEVLKRLPSNQRMALLLSRVDGFSYQEVADSLDSSVGAVKSLICRATATLRKDLADIL
jgi:RNA polymerase sigma factor (sigma-70 family)